MRISDWSSDVCSSDLRVLEAPERLQGAVVDDDVVAQQADLRSALHNPLGHHAAGHLADLGVGEHLAALGVAQEVLLLLGRQAAAPPPLHVVPPPVHARVVADFHPVPPRPLPPPRLGAPPPPAAPPAPPPPPPALRPVAAPTRTP